jgi:serine/threonine protein kinase
VLRDRYVLEALLGAGDRVAGPDDVLHDGAVYKAFDRLRSTLPGSQQYVALKILHSNGECSDQTLASLSLAFHRGQVLSHRNIVNVHALDRDGDLVFSTMELLEGEPLSDVLGRLGPAAMQKSQAWQLIEQLGAGLAHAHERGVVHGALEPRNIFITGEGELRILGFGAPDRFEAVQPGPEEPLSASGTLGYMSCEQLEGRRADPRDDLYALACICYELLAGTPPFGSRPATVARNYRVGLVRPAGLTGRQWRALQKGLSWHRGGRSISVQAWMQLMMKQRARDQPATPLHELSQPQPVQSRMPRQVAALSLIATLGAVAVLAKFGVNFERKSSGTRSPSVASSSVASDGYRRAPAPLAAAPLTAPPATDSAIPDSSSARKDAARRDKPAARAAAPAISVDPAPVRSDDHFAEIRLGRNLAQKNSSFTWWTEPATAKPEVDYVPEAVALQTFPSGFRATRLYVRLLPQPLRSQRSYFYIAIAQAGPHQTPATVIRRQVWLPASSNLQARR